MTYIKKLIRKPGILLFFFATVLLTCDKVKDYCGTGALYNPLYEGCVQDGSAEVVGKKCSDTSVVPFGTPCEGYTITTEEIPKGGGSIKISPDTTIYTARQPVILNASPNKGYAFVGWAGELIPAGKTDTTVTVTMNGINSNKTMIAIFKPIDSIDDNTAAKRTLTATASPNNGGAVTRKPNASTYDTGDTVTVIATAKSGYKFSGWAGADTSKKDTVKLQ